MVRVSVHVCKTKNNCCIENLKFVKFCWKLKNTSTFGRFLCRPWLSIFGEIPAGDLKIQTFNFFTKLKKKIVLGNIVINCLNDVQSDELKKNTCFCVRTFTSGAIWIIFVNCKFYTASKQNRHVLHIIWTIKNFFKTPTRGHIIYKKIGSIAICKKNHFQLCLHFCA